MTQAIGILDSGIGGLTVLDKIHSLLPRENLIYFGDNKNAPYGIRNHQEIQELSMKIIDFLLSKECKLIVIACNTITIAVLEDIQKYNKNIPIIGVVESGVNASVKATINNNIGILATPYAIKSEYFTQKMKALKSDINVFLVSCDELAARLERGWTDQDMPCLQKYVSQLPLQVDTILLGCTHYPLLSKEIEKMHPCFLIDPADKTALATQKYLQDHQILNKSETLGTLMFYTSGSIDQFQKMIQRYFTYPFTNVYNHVL